MTANQKNHYSALFSDIFLDLQEDITLNQKKKILDPEWLWDLMDTVLLPMKLQSGRGGRWEGAPATRGSRHSVPCGTRLGSQSPEQNICTAFPIELWTSDTAVSNRNKFKYIKYISHILITRQLHIVQHLNTRQLASFANFNQWQNKEYREWCKIQYIQMVKG